MTIAEVRARAHAFQSRIRWRNWTEYAAAAFVIVFFGWTAASVPLPVMQIGAVLIMLGAVYVCWKLNALARAASKGAADAALSIAAFHRAELVRQREALRTVWRWYLAPFAPGMVVFLAGVAFAPELEAPLAAKVGVFALGIGFVGAMFAAVAWLNARAVKQLDAEIAALDRN